MAKNFVEEGKRIKIAASGAAISSGQLVLLPGLAVVALVDIADGAQGAAEAEGVYELPNKIAGTAIAQGAKVYWNEDGDPQGGTAGSGCITTVASDGTDPVVYNQHIGTAWKAAGENDPTVLVKLNA